MSNPHEGGGMSVTLKSDNRDGAWIVFHGSPAKVRENIIETFELEGDDKTQPLFGLVSQVEKLHKAAGNAAKYLGGRVIDKPASGTPSGPAWEATANEPQLTEAEKLEARLLEQVEGVPHIKALKELWAANQEAFKAPALETAYMAKGKSLKEAGLIE